ncbi:hypothetical protein ABZY02_03320 [Streptomyces sp. NPDC006649]|uniref:hypothetical protein n=1 Tax=Streptomyces sp. NPDC006649 TaxID=3156896 RepID=UPI0033AEC3BA
MANELHTVATLLGGPMAAGRGAGSTDAVRPSCARRHPVARSPSSCSAELNRTAVRLWWPRRLAVLLALTALAAGSLALAVPGGAQEFGAPAVVRNLLGAEGIATASAAVIGARLSWLPVIAFLSSAYLAGGGPAGRAVLVWDWPVRPGAQPGAWVTASLLFLGGATLYTVRGARRDDSDG